MFPQIILQLKTVMSYQFSTNETYEPLAFLSCYMEEPHRIKKVGA